MIDLETIRLRAPLPEIVGRVAPLQKRGNEWIARCPFHADRSPSFTIYQASNGLWTAHCFGCGWHGDVLNFAQQAYGFTFAEAVRSLLTGRIPTLPLPKLCQSAPTGYTNTEYAQSLWHHAGPPENTPAEAYLRGRGIKPPFPPSLRFSNLPCGNSGIFPCLVFAIRSREGEITAVQRIWVNNDGNGKAAVPNSKRSLGRVIGGAIRLGEVDETGIIKVCEGPEDGLSLLKMVGPPVWVAGGASFLPAMEFPPMVSQIIIGADNDQAGRLAAHKAASAFAARGLEVRILYPLNGFKDFNDELRGMRA